MSQVGAAYGVIGLQLANLQQNAQTARGILNQLKQTVENPLQTRIDSAQAARALNAIQAAQDALLQSSKNMQKAFDDEADAMARMALEAQRASLQADTLSQKFSRMGDSLRASFQASPIGQGFQAIQARMQAAQAQPPEPDQQQQQGGGPSVMDLVKGNLIAQGIQRLSGAVMNYGRMAIDAYASNERLALSLQSLVAKEDVSTGRAKDITTAMAGAAGRAKDLLSWNQKLAVESPFSQEGVAQAFRMATAYGFVTDSSNKADITSKRLVTSLINFTSATGGTEATMSRISLALGQIQAKGKLAGGEVLQLTDAGLNVRGILAEAFGKSTEEIVRMQEKGLIPAKRAITAIVESLERDFGGAAKAQANTITGLLNSISDLKQIALREVFSGVLEAARPFMVQVVEKLSDPQTQAQLHQFGVSIGDGLKSAIPALVTTGQALVENIKPLIPMLLQIGSIIKDNLGPILAGLAASKVVGFLPGLLKTGGMVVDMLKKMTGAAGTAGTALEGSGASAARSAAGWNMATNAIIAWIAAYEKYLELRGQIDEGKRGVEEKVITGAGSFEEFQKRRQQAQELGDQTAVGKALGLGNVKDMTIDQFEYEKALVRSGVAEKDAISRARDAAPIFDALARARRGVRLETTLTGHGGIAQQREVQGEQMSDAQAGRVEEAVGGILTTMPEAQVAVNDLTKAFSAGKMGPEEYARALELMNKAIQEGVQANIERAHYEDLEEQRLNRIIPKNAEVIDQQNQLAAQSVTAQANASIQQQKNQELQQAAQAAADSNLSLADAAATLDGNFHTGKAAAEALITALRDLKSAADAAAGIKAKDEARQQFMDDRAFDPRMLAHQAATDPMAEAKQFLDQQNQLADEAYKATQKRIAAQEALTARTRALGTDSQKAALAQQDLNLAIARFGAGSAEAIQAKTALDVLRKNQAEAAEARAKKEQKTADQIEDIHRQSYIRLLQMQEDYAVQSSRSEEDFERQKRRLLAEGKIFEARQLEEDFRIKQRRADEDFSRQQARTIAQEQEQIAKKEGRKVAPYQEQVSGVIDDREVRRLRAAGDVEGARRAQEQLDLQRQRQQQDVDRQNKYANMQAGVTGVPGGRIPPPGAPLAPLSPAQLRAGLAAPALAPGAPAAPGQPQTLVINFTGQVMMDGQQVGMIVGPTVNQQLTDSLAVQLQIVGGTQPVGGNQAGFRIAQ